VAKFGWLILTPPEGKKFKKTRPVVILSANLFNPIPLRIVIPITSWQDKFSKRPFMVRINASAENGLDRDSAGNVL